MVRDFIAHILSLGGGIDFGRGPLPRVASKVRSGKPRRGAGRERQLWVAMTSPVALVECRIPLISISVP